MKDMLHELMTTLTEEPDILKIQQTGGLKSYKRREELGEEMTSITVIPIGPPAQAGFGSNTSLVKHVMYQVCIEATDRMVCKEFQKKVENLFQTKGFYQMSGGLDEYFIETKRFVDARFYQGYSKPYEEY